MGDHCYRKVAKNQNGQRPEVKTGLAGFVCLFVFCLFVVVVVLSGDKMSLSRDMKIYRPKTVSFVVRQLVYHPTGENSSSCTLSGCL